MDKNFTVDTSNADLLRQKKKLKANEDMLNQKLVLALTTQQFDDLKRFQKKSEFTSVNAFIRSLVISRLSEMRSAEMQNEVAGN
jgi:hypothetical protein